MKSKRGSKYMNTVPLYKHRVPTTKELGREMRESKHCHTAGLIWRTLTRHPKGPFATRSRLNFAGCLRGSMRCCHTRLYVEASEFGRGHA